VGYPGAMTNWGYTLSSEEHGPCELVRYAQRAEEVGFDFLTISDHYHPWLESQGQSPFVWTTIGGVAATTSRVRLAVGVCCPLIRIHPAIVAQAAATSAAAMEGRFLLGVGTGEALNEHITGVHWPTIETRREMLRDAVQIMRDLWTGETVDHVGAHYTVENARLFTLPDEPPSVVVSAFGEGSAAVAADIGDGLWSTAPDHDLLAQYSKAGGTGPRIGQVSVCWAPDEEDAVRTAYEWWPNTVLEGQLSQDLPTWTHFKQACALVTPDDVRESVPCGPDPDRVVESLRTYEKAGYDHIHVHQIGPDQEGFLRFWERDVLTRL
jgi:coenzyme F420-dependent glucose-6-phosphate dehydrogenase